MKKVFKNQTGDSNKFWIIEQIDNSYTVTWGKIGTDGRTITKDFADFDDCNKEVEKIIKEKIGKGYTLITESSQIQETKEMTEELFWEIIASFNWSKTGDDEAVLKLAINILASMTIEDIYKFDDLLSEKLFQLDGITYASNIGEESYKGEGHYFSSDNFLYVRCCVVANGNKYFNRVISDPRKMPKEMEFEALIDLPSIAYFKKTKKEDYNHEPKFNYETYSNTGKWSLEWKPNNSEGKKKPFWKFW